MLEKVKEYVNKIVDKVQKNGISLSHTGYELEKLVAFNWQIFICLVVSCLFIGIGIFFNFHVLTALSSSYLILFGFVFYAINKNRLALARNLYLFVSNYAVFSITFCFGYNAGFYFYFFTTPLTVYITFGNSKRGFIYIGILTYLINAILLNVMYHNGLLPNPGMVDELFVKLLFNVNLLIAFFMIFMFITSLFRMNALKTKEAELLNQKQRMLEAEIHQRQLDDAEVRFQYRKLEGEYQQLDLFNHILSHNLRGPISRVSGLIELMKKIPFVSEEQKVLMGHLNSSVLMIDEVIKDLNHILVQRELVRDPVHFLNLRVILEEVKQHLSLELEESKALVNTSFSIEGIYSVKGILVSIFYNLISNSIKYAMPGQKPTIYISSKIKDQKVELIFKDEGIGFDSEKYGEKLFRLYSRLHTHIAGKGMGLFLVKSHIDVLNGSISVESMPRRGTKFTIILPIKDKAAIVSLRNAKKVL